MAPWKSSIYHDIPIAPGGHPGGRQRALTLDLYIPHRTDAHPAGTGRPALIVYIHGGGWHEGTNDRPPGFRTILARGMALASLPYRFSQEASGIEMLADLRRGVQIARREASRHDVDIDTWFLWGISAGGHLASLIAHRLNDPEVLALAPAASDPSPIPAPAAVAPWCGVFDLAYYRSLEGVGDELRETVTEIEHGLTGGTDAERSALSPLCYAGSQSPPHLFVHGREDPLVPAAQSVRMHEALRGVGVRSELLVVPDRDHAMPPGDSPELHRTIDFLLSCTRSQRSAAGGETER